MKNIVEFKNVCKEFGSDELKTVVLNGVTFSIHGGEILIIIGSSGAGKSTILNLLGGLDSATSGEIFVGEEDISKYNEKQLSDYRAEKVGIIFQAYNLIPNLTALENVVFGSEVKQDTLSPEDILKKVGLQDKLNKFPSTLSGGEQQRVAIARALAKNPLLLLCDEPTGALDYQTSKAVLELLEQLNQEFHKTVIIVTHNLALLPMADRVITVKNGKIFDVKENGSRKSVKELEW
ncbi:ABC transporter ATP-binding protein [Enterococcus sp. AZ109]|uniref:ABC transporter ATP-binding protein n=1 Tax=Enterococcus sp. AZ109 TaxID=2774634 RepID=UPI003F2580BC